MKCNAREVPVLRYDFAEYSEKQMIGRGLYLFFRLFNFQVGNIRQAPVFGIVLKDKAVGIITQYASQGDISMQKDQDAAISVIATIAIVVKPPTTQGSLRDSVWALLHAN